MVKNPIHVVGNIVEDAMVLFLSAQCEASRGHTVLYPPLGHRVSEHQGLLVDQRVSAALEAGTCGAT